MQKRILSNIIPLGLIRFGGLLERAILFKVLADRISIPTNLYRTEKYGWCELPILTLTDEGIYFDLLANAPGWIILHLDISGRNPPKQLVDIWINLLLKYFFQVNV